MDLDLEAIETERARLREVYLKADRPASSARGLHHVALRVPDLQAAVDRLRAAGARLLNEPRAGAGGHLYVFVDPSSTGGVLLELIQENA